MPLKNWLIKHALLPLGDQIMGHPMMRRLHFLEKAQWWSPQQIEEERQLRLRELVRTTYSEVPFYRDLFDQNKISPESIKTVQDLRRLPIVTKAMLRSNYPERTCRPTGQKTYETSTSGSTGSNFWVREDAQTSGWHRASFMLALHWAGWHIGEPHLQTGITAKRNLERRLKDAIMGCHYRLSYKIDDAELDTWLELLDRKVIRHLWGYPCSLYHLSLRARKVGFNRELTSVVTWGDQLYPAYRESIESAFKTRVFDTYGCGEGIQIAAQCGQNTHYHIHSLDVIVEFVNDEGEPVPEGSPGTLLITRLHAGPMPLVRYQLGDVGVDGSGMKCSCGREFQVLKSIVGRTADVITTPSGNRLVVHFFTGVLEHFPEIETFQIVQQSADSLLLRIVPTPRYGEAAGAAICEALVRKGADMKIAIEIVKEIPLTSGGKRRFVIKL